MTLCDATGWRHPAAASRATPTTCTYCRCSGSATRGAARPKRPSRCCARSPAMRAQGRPSRCIRNWVNISFFAKVLRRFFPSRTRRTTLAFSTARTRRPTSLPNVEIGSNVTLNAVVVDKHCRLPAGLVVGINAEQDRRRFHVTPSGVTVITPEMLGQALHSAIAGLPDSRSEGIRLEHAVQRRIEESGSGLKWTSPHRNVPRHGTPPSARTP